MILSAERFLLFFFLSFIGGWQPATGASPPPTASGCGLTVSHQINLIVLEIDSIHLGKAGTSWSFRNYYQQTVTVHRFLTGRSWTTDMSMTLPASRRLCTNLVVSANGELQVGHILPQLPPGGVDLHSGFRDHFGLPGLQVLHLPQHGRQLQGEKM